VHHYLFTVENAAEVDEIITAARVGKAPRGDVRRI